MGLRLKLGVFVVGFVSFVLVLVGVFQARAERQIYHDEMRRHALILLRSFSVPCAIAMANNDITTLDAYIERFAESAHTMDLEYIAALDFSRRVVAHTSPHEFGGVYDDPFTLDAAGSDEPITYLEETDDETRLRVAVPVVSGLRWGTLEASFTLAAIEHTITRKTNRSILISVLVSIGVAAIVYLLLSMLVVRPVVRMENMARQFGRGDLDARVHLCSDDEMGSLATQLNSMAQQIQSYTYSLEQLVQARTAELADANTRLIEANRQLDRLAKTDPLTGLYNRRYFLEQLGFEIQRGARTHRHFTLVIVDVDHFKHYNDTHGHSAGDVLLQRLATLLELNLRSIDLVARYGGEEFVVLLLDTAAEAGFATAQKLRQAVADQSFPFEETQPGGKLTISAGVAFYPEDSQDGHTLIDYADRALYEAKDAGRNNVKRWIDLASD